LLSGLKSTQSQLHQATGKYVPLAVKIAPDNDEQIIFEIAEALVQNEMDAVIATNTTLDRQTVQGHKYANEAGGLSGEVLCDKSLIVTRTLSEALSGKLPIIGVGGISSKQSAQARIDAGASLLQIYSSFIYQGPALLRELANV